jgi:hypothetical protein
MCVEGEESVSAKGMLKLILQGWVRRIEYNSFFSFFPPLSFLVCVDSQLKGPVNYIYIYIYI